MPVLKEGEDYYFNQQGLMVMTEQYHLKRGYCCKSGCKHCPWGYGKIKDSYNQIPIQEKPSE